MLTIHVEGFDDWRRKARQLINQNAAPGNVKLLDKDGQRSLFAAEIEVETGGDSGRQFRVPQAFIQLSKTVGYHRSPERWNLLYRTLWRIKNEQSSLLEIETDDDVHHLARMEKQVRRDAHKMKAFVRFRKVQRGEDEFFIAWHQPDHRIVRKVAPFFSRRFAGMNWSILTPDESVSWDQQKLHYSDGVTRKDAPKLDELEELWRTYYANIFNPARVKVKMMKSEMAVRYWKNLPEAEIIDDLLANAPRRVEQMIQEHEGFQQTAIDYITRIEEEPFTLQSLQEMAQSCKACDLHCDATQTVFGTGPANAKIVLLGEQPGDEEDEAGKPFIGPAGKLLNEALRSAGLDRRSLYLSNVVKHFKYQLKESDSSRPTKRNKRLHQKPNAREIRCCRPWFDAEWSCLEESEVLVCMGATAASTILGPGQKVSKIRGMFFESDYCQKTIVTWHPASILRTRDTSNRELKMRQLVSDLNSIKPSPSR